MNISDGEWHSFYENIKNIPQFREFQELIVPEVPMDAKIFLFIHSITEGKTLPELYENKKWMKQVSKATETELNERSKRQQYIDQKYNKFQLAVPLLNLTETREYIVKACIESIYNGYKIVISSGGFGDGIRGASDLSKNVYNEVQGIDDTGFQSFAVALIKLPVFIDFQNDLESWVPSNAKVFLFIHKMVENKSLSEIYGEQSWLKTQTISKDSPSNETDGSDEDIILDLLNHAFNQYNRDSGSENPGLDGISDDIQRMISAGEHQESQILSSASPKVYKDLDFKVSAHCETSNESELKYSIEETSEWLTDVTVNSTSSIIEIKELETTNKLLKNYFRHALNYLFNTSEAISDTNRLGEERLFVVQDEVGKSGITEYRIKSISGKILRLLGREDLVNEIDPKFNVDNLFRLIKLYIIDVNKKLKTDKDNYFEYDTIDKKVIFEPDNFTQSDLVDVALWVKFNYTPKR